jgi:hypothetical protein
MAPSLVSSPCPAKAPNACLDQPRLVEFFRLLDEDLPGEVGMTELGVSIAREFGDIAHYQVGPLHVSLRHLRR